MFKAHYKCQVINITISNLHNLQTVISVCVFYCFTIIDGSLYYCVCLADEQDRIQKKTFTKWINSFLAKVCTLVLLFQVLKVLSSL